MHASAFFRQLATLILGHERKQQLRISRSLTAAFVFLACIGLQIYAYRHGFMEAQYVWRLSIVILVNVVFWYALLRSGLNLRFRDPALTLPQVLSALTIITYAYSVTGRIHGSIMMLLTLVQVFGIFNMSQRDSRLAGFYSLGLMGCAMVYKTLTDPENYPYQLELAHFILIAAILPTISSLAGQLNSMRMRLQSQKNELAQALTRIQILATRDELTGLFNRRHMMEVLTQHQKRLIRSGHHRFCLALLDIDHFKRINDTHGHGVGDEVLREFAATLQRALRDNDVFARWGGEEFLLLINDTSPELANIGLERARDMLASAPLLAHMPDLRVTFSAGLTGYDDVEELSICIERADQALYRAKAEGRNRTVIDDQLPSLVGKRPRTPVAAAH
ncbi:GGDEF domain-containing protein [Aquabacterium sp.]|uniref:GGDEF domain-containing protein n=1 Tax=Aquabacterium sp. TaxID=1872578 RepID=UPI003B6E5B15